MDIPINADVQCSDGPAGHTVCVIINSVTKRVTHVVVKEKGFPYLKRVVPLELIAESTPQHIRLRCTKRQLAILKPFLEIEYDQNDRPYFAYEVDEYRLWPYVTTELLPIPIELERIPPGELTIHRGSQVRASDGRIGQVNEFLVDPGDGHITHLVLREGHLWGQKDVTIPVSEIKEIDDDVVYLKLDKHDVEKLPAIPIRRKK